MSEIESNVIEEIETCQNPANSGDVIQFTWTIFPGDKKNQQSNRTKDGCGWPVD